MNDGDALLAAVCSNPNDDTPRLVYADWLDENGQPERAELIRLQCSVSEEVDRDVIEDRVAELVLKHSQRWLAGLPRHPWVAWEFCRGFPEVVIAPGELFLERYESFAHLLGVRSLCLDQMSNSLVRDFTSRRWNSAWVELELQEHAAAGIGSWGYDSGPSFVAIARCTQTRQLRRLRFSLFTLTPTAVNELAESPNLAQLDELQLEGDPESPLITPLLRRFGDRLVVDCV